MQVSVNKVIEQLYISDPDTGCEWTRDLIGDNHDGYDGDTGVMIMSLETYNQWDRYIDNETALQNRMHALKTSLNHAADTL